MDDKPAGHDGSGYRLRQPAQRGNEVVGETTVGKVGVGEVFITAGQSNSANFGKPRQAAKDERVVYFNGNDFVRAHDPIPGGCGGGGSVWPIVGDLVAGSQQVPVCFRSATLTWTEVKTTPTMTSEQLFDIYKYIREMGGNFLLNVGLMPPDGEQHPGFRPLLLELKKKIDTYEASLAKPAEAP